MAADAASDRGADVMWQTMAVAVAVVAAIVAIHAGTVADMVAVWARSDTFAHGFLILPISVWLMWRERALLMNVRAAPAAMWLALLALASGVWLAAALVDLKSPAQFALVAMVVSAVATLMGSAFFKAAAFPLLFLFFAPPAGEFLLPWMMEATADFTTTALQLSGVPVYREGLQFRIPSGHWSVVEACSGLRYLIASVMAGSLFAYLSYRSVKRRVLFVLASVLVPLLANWLRAYLIVMLGHFSDNRLAAGADHLVYGWVFFALVMAALFAIGSRFREDDVAVPVAVAVNGPPPSPAPLGHALAVLVVVGAAPLLLTVLNARAFEVPASHALPGLVAGWQMEEAPVVWEPHWVGAQSVRAGTYRLNGERVSVVVAHYPGGVGRPVSSDNVLVKTTDREWVRVGADRVSVPRVGELEQAVIEGRQGRFITWAGLHVGGVLTERRTLAALWLALARLTGRADDVAWVAFYTADDADAQARLRRFVEHAGLAVLSER